MKKITCLSPRGFCFGVKRALTLLENALPEHPFVLNEIVHNDFVVRSFEEKGARFVTSLDDVPDGATLVISAHGVGLNILEQARRKNLKIIDTTCPFVRKVHLFVQQMEKEGLPVILIGKKNHAEIIGTLGQLNEKAFVIADLEEIKSLPPLQKAAVATQTTLCADETEHLISALQKRIPFLKTQSHVCEATKERQEAVRNACAWLNVLLVVGDKKSSNAHRLVETAERLGKKAFLIADASEIPELGTEENIAVTAAASTPEELVREVVDKLSKKTSLS